MPAVSLSAQRCCELELNFFLWPVRCEVALRRPSRWRHRMPKTVTIRDEAVALELDPAQLGLLDRALGGYAKALQGARDLGVISHETFCRKSDRARAVQYLVWEAQERLGAVAPKASQSDSPPAQN